MRIVAILDHDRSENCRVDDLVRTAETTQITIRSTTKATINRNNHTEHTVTYPGAVGFLLHPFLIALEVKVVVSMTILAHDQSESRCIVL